MAKACQFSLLLLLLLLLLLQLLFVSNVYSQSAPAPKTDDDDDENEDPIQEKWIWCVEDSKDLELCKQMNAVVDKLDPEPGEHTRDCVAGGDAETCMKMIAGKVPTSGTKPMMGIFDGGEIWKAYNEYGLKPVRTEAFGESSYYGVGVVRANQCPKQLSDLRGRRSCHTGYGRSAGWVLPVTYFMDNNIMPLVSRKDDVSNDVESVKAFFSKSCAVSDDPAKSICTACKQTVNCTEEDEYYDYSGAFRCLVEGSGDVAFTKHSIPGLYVKGGSSEENWANLQEASGYKILCPTPLDGSLCADISSYKHCNFGVAPGHTIMVWGNFSSEEIDEFNVVMDKANNDAAFRALFKDVNLLANEFAAGISASIKYNDTVEKLLGPLLNNTFDLQTINGKATVKGSSTNLLPSASVTFFMLLLVAVLL